jgi:hypothetical protein
MGGNANARKLQMDGDGNFDGLSAMGFDVLHRFDEITCDAVRIPGAELTSENQFPLI